MSLPADDYDPTIPTPLDAEPDKELGEDGECGFDVDRTVADWPEAG